MRRTRLLVTAIASLIGTVLGEGLAKRAIAIFVSLHKSAISVA
jgi:hypothetical protein